MAEQAATYRKSMERNLRMKRYGNSLLTTIFISLLLHGLAGCASPKLSCSQAAAQIAKSDNAAIKPATRDGQWMNRHTAINERVKQGSDAQVIFVGDSITQGWEKFPQVWDEYFGKFKPINAGIGGDRTQHVLWRLENGNLSGIKPKVAVVMIGTNNSNKADFTAEQIAEGVEAIVCTLRTKLPETKVLLLAIFPRGSDEQRKDKTQNADFNSQWAKNDKTSRLASQLADGKMVVYLDINKKFLDKKGILTREVMPDLLHLSEKGYRIWGQAILPTLEKMSTQE
jgi:lysophospholipase L1-like esterase